MTTYSVTLGDQSNVAKGDRFQSNVVKDILLEKYSGRIKFFYEEFKLPDVKIIMDFYIVLDNGQHIFVEAKYRNGKGGKGLAKEEATHSALNAAMMTQYFCSLKKIKNYKFIIYTNGLPKPGGAADTWISIHRKQFKTIDDIIVVTNCEEEVENSNFYVETKKTSTLDGFLNG